jgi:hypothetical protein
MRRRRWRVILPKPRGAVPSAEADWSIKPRLPGLTSGLFRFRRDGLIFLSSDHAQCAQSCGFYPVYQQDAILFPPDRSLF